jgi:hypothetical protein
MHEDDVQQRRSTADVWGDAAESCVLIVLHVVT